MAAWRFALLVVLSCLTMRESVVQLADLVEGSWSTQSPVGEEQRPSPQTPVPLEGEGKAWLVADSEDTHDCLSFLLPEPKLLARQVSCDAAHGGGLSPRAVLSALHRLRI
jgi:hypothetical protein